MKIRQLLLASFMIGSLASLNAYAVPNSANHIMTTAVKGSHAKDVEILFTQTAKSASLKKINDKNYMLTLHNINQNTLWFSDRPERAAGTMTTEKFLQNWSKGSNSFAKSNPNANLVSVANNTKGMNTVLEGMYELSTPQYDVKTDDLSYNAKVIGNATNINNQNSRELGEVALFIDGCGWFVC